MEHIGLLVHGNFTTGSGLDTLFLHSKLSTDGTSAVVDVNDIKCSQYCLKIPLVAIYTLLKTVHIESRSTLSVMWKMILNFEVMLLIYMGSIQGNFELYLASLCRMLPWFFILDQ